MKARVSAAAPMPSAISVNTATRRRTVRTEPRSRAPADSWARIRSLSAVRRPTTSRSRSVDPVMNPKPPTWISARIAIWPNGLQYVPVSTTTRPVTQTADVAVNSAVTGWVQVPAADEIGSVRTAVPIAIITMNPSASTTAGRRGGRRIARRTSTRNDWGPPCRLAIARSLAAARGSPWARRPLLAPARQSMDGCSSGPGRHVPVLRVGVTAACRATRDGRCS